MESHVAAAAAAAAAIAALLQRATIMHFSSQCKRVANTLQRWLQKTVLLFGGG
jgi:hypothetical protein